MKLLDDGQLDQSGWASIVVLPHPQFAVGETMSNKPLNSVLSTSLRTASGVHNREPLR